MDSERWRVVKAIFQEALDQPPDARTVFLERACHGDAGLHREIRSLLKATEDASFLEDPVTVGALLPFPDASAPLPPDAAIGPYRILRELGHGGMGAVYLARRADGQFQRHVALKVIRSGFDSEELRRRFRYERQILATLRHPNIAQLLDGGVTADGRPYLVMEHVEGLPLLDYCDAHRLTTPQRLTLFCIVCKAVHHAHQNLVVHRDLKPSNILVTEEGQAKLLDFGIAKLMDEQAFAGAGLDALPQTRTGMQLMTPEYASPEQVRGEPVSTASDLYALGVILYELLTGHRPYRVQGLTPGEVEHVVCEREPDKPSTAVTRVEKLYEGTGETRRITPEDVGQARSTPPEKLRRRLRGDLDNIVLMALRKEPARRYASAEQLAEDVRRHLLGRPVEARTATWSYRVAKFARRHQIGVAATVGILAVLASLVGFYTARLAQERDVAQREAAKAAQINTFLQEMLAAADPSRDGRDVRVIDVLDEAARRVETELGGQPEVEAEVRSTLGITYQGLGLYDEAEPHLEQALALRKTRHGETHPDVARSLYNLGWLAYRKGDYPAGETYFRRALALQQARFGETHLDVARSLHGLATVLMPKGDYAAAEQASRRALDVYRALYGDQHLDVAEALDNLGMTLWGQGNYEDAEPLLRQALALKRTLLGTQHLSVLNTMHNLALVLKAQGAYPAAEALLRESNALSAALLGDEHPEMAAGLLSLASVLQAQGKYDEAERLHRQALALRRTLYGDENHEVASSLSFLAQVLEAQGKYDEAERLHRQALALRRTLYGDEHLDVAYSLYYLGVLLRKKGDYADAERFARQSLAVSRALLGADHPDLTYDLNSLAATLEAQARYADAEPLLLESYALLHAKGPPSDDYLRETLHHLADFYERWGKPDQAAAYRAMLAEE